MPLGLEAAPRPSCPYWSAPQHSTAPSYCSAQTCEPPAASSETLERLRTNSGVLLTVPSWPEPSCPTSLRPQHTTEVSLCSAQAWVPPAAMRLTWVENGVEGAAR